MPNDDEKRPDLHHSQGVLVAEVLSGVDPAKAMAEEVMEGFDDVVSVWMALITERERLQHIVDTRRVQEPMFGPAQSWRQLSDEEVEDVKKKLVRVTALAAMAMDRRKEIAAAFAEVSP